MNRVIGILMLVVSFVLFYVLVIQVPSSLEKSYEERNKVWFECIYEHKELPSPKEVCYAIEQLEKLK